MTDTEPFMRQTYFVLASLWLVFLPVVSTAEEEPGQGSTDRSHCHSLGFPTKDKRVEARGLCELRYFEGKLYLGHGDYGVNTGPTDVLAFGLREKEFTTEFTVQDEAIVRYRILDGHLVIPGVDATESWDFGNVYVKAPSSSPWKKHRKIPRGLHVFDAADSEGAWYVCTGSSDPDRAKGTYGAVFRSLDHGETWTEDFRTEMDPSKVIRIAGLLPFKKRLLAFPYAYTKRILADPLGEKDTLVLENDSWRSLDLFERSLFRVERSAVLDDLALVCAVHPVEGPEVKGERKLYRWDGDSMRGLTPRVGRVLDLEVCEGRFLLLCQDKEGRHVLSTGDLKMWEVVTLPPDLEALSTFLVGDALFLGTKKGELLFCSFSRLAKPLVE
ncbi:MAG: hypothetical protein ACYTFG_03065 [Planctomycetota bacterium]|jgi:hypothetical protein